MTDVNRDRLRLTLLLIVCLLLGALLVESMARIGYAVADEALATSSVDVEGGPYRPLYQLAALDVDGAEPAIATAPSSPPSTPVYAADPTSDPGAAVDMVVSLARRGYLAAVAHLLLFWLGLLALARSAWLTTRAPWLARGRVLVFVSGLVANLAITLPAAVAGTATWRGLAFAAFGAVLLWIQPVVTKLAAGAPTQGAAP